MDRRHARGMCSWCGGADRLAWRLLGRQASALLGSRMRAHSCARPGGARPRRLLGLGCRARKAEQGGRDGADGDGHVEPGEEGALVGEERLGLYPHGRRAREGLRRGRLAALEVPVEPAALAAAALLAPGCTAGARTIQGPGIRVGQASTGQPSGRGTAAREMWGGSQLGEQAARCSAAVLLVPVCPCSGRGPALHRHAGGAGSPSGWGRTVVAGLYELQRGLVAQQGVRQLVVVRAPARLALGVRERRHRRRLLRRPAGAGPAAAPAQGPGVKSTSAAQVPTCAGHGALPLSTGPGSGRWCLLRQAAQ